MVSYFFYFSCFKGIFYTTEKEKSKAAGAAFKN
jgi:hypothetical protein